MNKKKSRHSYDARLGAKFVAAIFVTAFTTLILLGVTFHYHYFVFSVLIVIVGTLLITKQITRKLKEIDIERGALFDQLVHYHKLASIGTLTTSIAHEINNPLAIIAEKVGWMEDLLSEGDIKNIPTYRELADANQAIQKYVERVKRITHRLLGFGRRAEMVCEEIDVNALLDATVYFVEKEAEFRNIAIIKKYQLVLPRTFSDEVQLEQVFVNVVNNAIDAIKKNGTIYISTKCQNGNILVSITDTGPGMTKEISERIFDPFYTTKLGGKGTGLGLSVSYDIIKGLGGGMTVESEVGKGTTFHITVPISWSRDRGETSGLRGELSSRQSQ